MTSVLSRIRTEETSRGRLAGNGAAPEIALLPIGADLLPQKAATSRGGRGRRLVAIGIVLVAVVAVAGTYLFSLHARSAADSDLVAAQDQQRSLQVQQKSFDQLVRTQALDGQLTDALGTIMKTDTAWSILLAGLSKVDDGIVFNSIAASLADPTAPVATGTAPTTPGQVGTLTISGTAADKATIATFVDAVGGLPGLVDPFLSTVTAVAGSAEDTAGGYSFTVTVAITGDLQSAASGRWAPTTGGGK